MNRRNRRWRDNVEFAASIICTVVVIGYAVLTVHALSSIHSDQQAQKDAGRQRLVDLRSSCRRASKKTAAQVNQYYTYYLTEVKLGSTQIPPGFQAALKTLTPGEKRFFRVLLGDETKKPSSSAQLLQIRAATSKQAAYQSARTVDVRDAGLITANFPKPFGLDLTPRKWVLQADYSCIKAYPAKSSPAS